MYFVHVPFNVGLILNKSLIKAHFLEKIISQHHVLFLGDLHPFKVIMGWKETNLVPLQTFS